MTMGKPGRTRRAAAKRFTVTDSGHVKRRKANKSHILTKKAQDHKRRLRKIVLVDGDNMVAVRRMLPGARIGK